MKCSDFTILVAEDDLSLLNVYEKSLSGEGYRMIKAENGEQALVELGKAVVDLFITDIKMPGIGAFEMMPIIDRDYPKLPVVVISGNYDGLMENCHNKKGFGNVKRFFVKPLSMDVLKKNVKEVLNF